MLNHDEGPYRGSTIKPQLRWDAGLKEADRQLVQAVTRSFIPDPAEHSSHSDAKPTTRDEIRPLPEPRWRRTDGKAIFDWPLEALRSSDSQKRLSPLSSTVLVARLLDAGTVHCGFCLGPPLASC